MNQVYGRKKKLGWLMHKNKNKIDEMQRSIKRIFYFNILLLNTKRNYLNEENSDN